MLRGEAITLCPTQPVFIFFINGMCLEGKPLPYVRFNQSLPLFINGVCWEEKPLPYVWPNQSVPLFINGVCLEEKPLPYVRLNQYLL